MAGCLPAFVACAVKQSTVLVFLALLGIIKDNLNDASLEGAFLTSKKKASLRIAICIKLRRELFKPCTPKSGFEPQEGSNQSIWVANGLFRRLMDVSGALNVSKRTAVKP